mgnify:CR=1 FL=1
MNRVLKILKDPRLLFFTLAHRGLLNFVNDETFIKIAYRLKMGKRLELTPPVTFNEKLQWLKLYDRQPIYTKLVDKILVKEYVAQIIGREFIIPTYGVWDKAEDIDFQSLPSKFVLKVNHNSGGLVICTNKSIFNIKESIKKLDYALNHNYFCEQREWPYKDVPPKIFAEKYMEDAETKELRDYKFLCFHGVPKIMFIASERQSIVEETKFDFFDMDFKHLEIKNGHPMANIPPEKPRNFDLMKKLAEKLSKDIPHVRVDFYEVNGKVYFGELTFTHWSGLVPFEPEKWDHILGEWIDLSKVKQLNVNKK